MQQPLAEWNPELDYWQTWGAGEDIFGHSVAYSETLPKSGMTRGGRLYERPTSVPLTTEPESSSSPRLPTPTASEWKREDNPSQAHRNSPGITAVSVHFPETPVLPTPCAGDNVNDTESQHNRKSPALTIVSRHFPRPDKVLPAPNATMGERGPSKEVGGTRPSGQPRQVGPNTVVVGQMPVLPTPRAADPKAAMGSPGAARHVAKGYGSLAEVVGVDMPVLPTPNASDGTGGGQHPDKRVGHSRQLIDYARTMGDAKCLPTPKASDGVMGRPRTTGRPIEKSTHLGTIVTLLPDEATQPSMMGTDDYGPELAEPESPFGVYAPAVHRWERATGQAAPPPTELNSKGKPRLNAEFASWMMGLPPGWVTDPAIGLTRAQQLKAIGNGVCIPQCIAALGLLLNRQESE